MLTKNILQAAIGKQLWIDLNDGRSIFANLKSIDVKMNLELSNAKVFSPDGTESVINIIMLRGSAVKMFRFTDEIIEKVNDSVISSLNNKIKKERKTAKKAEKKDRKDTPRKRAGNN